MTDDDLLSFTGESNGQIYSFELKLFKPICWDKSEILEKDQNILISLVKKPNDGQNIWKRLSADKKKNYNIAVNFSRLIDDEVEETKSSISEEKTKV